MHPRKPDLFDSLTLYLLGLVPQAGREIASLFINRERMIAELSFRIELVVVESFSVEDQGLHRIPHTDEVCWTMAAKGGPKTRYDNVGVLVAVAYFRGIL